MNIIYKNHDISESVWTHAKKERKKSLNSLKTIKVI